LQWLTDFFSRKFTEERQRKRMEIYVGSYGFSNASLGGFFVSRPRRHSPFQETL
jgi:hypothetical protein